MTTTTVPLRVPQGYCEQSPINRVIAFGWYDGPEEGILQFGVDGPVFRFATLYKQANDDDSDTWVYGLFPLPDDALQRVIHALTPLGPPKWPCWCPIWKFANDAEAKSANRLVDEVISQAGPLSYVVVGRMIDGPIHVWAMPFMRAS
jgi:hypothetical protein